MQKDLLLLMSQTGQPGDPTRSEAEERLTEKFA
jgi:hypothetical protein